MTLKIQTSSKIIDELVKYVSKKYSIPNWDFIDWQYGSSDISDTGLSQELASYFSNAKAELARDGFIVLKIQELLDNYSDSEIATASTFILSVFGSPFRVFLNRPNHWRKLSIDPNRPPNRSGGTGLSPLHMDFVNASNPPDLVCLFAIRHDPLGGGESLISKFDDIEILLSKEHLATLSTAQFTDGMVNNLNGVGIDINPFAIINSNSHWRYRFTGNLIKSAPEGIAWEAIKAMADILESRMITFMLERGDMLIMNQHRVAHGRLPVGEGQRNIPESKRRFLYHSFVRA